MGRSEKTYDEWDGTMHLCRESGGVLQWYVIRSPTPDSYGIHFDSVALLQFRCYTGTATGFNNWYLPRNTVTEVG